MEKHKLPTTFSMPYRLRRISANAHAILDAMKKKHAAALGRLGGPARAKKLSKKRRKEIARQAANTRWNRLSTPSNTTA